jgi:IS30 family transposase
MASRSWINTEEKQKILVGHRLGKTTRQIGERIGRSHVAVSIHIKRMKKSGDLDQTIIPEVFERMAAEFEHGGASNDN